MEIAPTDMIRQDVEYRFAEPHAWARLRPFLEISLQVTSGRLVFIDPGELQISERGNFVGTPLEADSMSDFRLLGVEDEEEGDRIRSGAVAVVGETVDVERWVESIESTDVQLAFAVDGGMGCVFDPENVNKVRDYLARTPTEELFDLIQDEAFACIESSDAVVGVIFNCGMGDGAYKIWIGLSQTGRPVALLADLELLHHAVESRDC